jgi:hypothetical protein
VWTRNTHTQAGSLLSSRCFQTPRCSLLPSIADRNSPAHASGHVDPHPSGQIASALLQSCSRRKITLGGSVSIPRQINQKPKPNPNSARQEMRVPQEMGLGPCTWGASTRVDATDPSIRISSRAQIYLSSQSTVSTSDRLFTPICVEVSSYIWTTFDVCSWPVLTGIVATRGGTLTTSVRPYNVRYDYEYEYLYSHDCILCF